MPCIERLLLSKVKAGDISKSICRAGRALNEHWQLGFHRYISVLPCGQRSMLVQEPYRFNPSKD